MSAGLARRARGWWLALLCAAAQAAFPGLLHPAPDDPPAGFVWEDLKEIHARMLRPDKWFARCGVRGAPPFNDLRSGTGGKTPYEFSPQPFAGWEMEAGLWVSADNKVKDTYGKSAVEYAVECQAEMLGENAVLQSWTKRGVPCAGCTVRAVRFVNDEAGETDCMYESIFIVNEAADTLYIITVKAPRSRWKEIESVADTMLANLRIDPRY